MWKCRLIDFSKVDKDNQPQPGDMWFAPWLSEDNEYWEFNKTQILSPEYLRDWLGKRLPVFVCLPGGCWWSPDSRASGKDSGWTVTGEAPELTALPSINCVGSYHGWLQNGFLTDDCEGRAFPQEKQP
jgi:hypothetical protein